MKTDSKVLHEAKRLAKDDIKKQIRATDLSVSYVDTNDVAQAVDQLVTTKPKYIERAKKILMKKARS